MENYFREKEAWINCLFQDVRERYVVEGLLNSQVHGIEEAYIYALVLPFMHNLMACIDSKIVNAYGCDIFPQATGITSYFRESEVTHSFWIFATVKVDSMSTLHINTCNYHTQTETLKTLHRASTDLSVNHF